MKEYINEIFTKDIINLFKIHTFYKLNYISYYIFAIIFNIVLILLTFYNIKVIQKMYNNELSDYFYFLILPFIKIYNLFKLICIKIYNLFKFIFTSIYNLFKFIVKSIYNLFKSLFINIFKLFKYIIKCITCNCKNEVKEIEIL